MRKLLTALAIVVLSVALSAQEEKPAAPATAAPAAEGPVPDQDVTPDLAKTIVGTPEQPVALIETSMGNFRCVLFKKEAPATVENFIGLANGSKDWTDPDSGAKKHHVPLYPGTQFHRVIPNFMIQGGDPTGTGMGHPGYSFRDEFRDYLTFDRPGRLAMANSGPDTNGSQFFITEVPTPHLDGHHTIFGQCDNIDLVQRIARVPRDPNNDKPLDPVTITKITFEGVKPPPRPTVHHAPASSSPAKPKSTPQ